MSTNMLPRKPYRIPETQKKTAGQQIKEDIIFVIVGVVIYYLIVCTFKAIFSPLRYLFASDKELYAEDEQKALAKIDARKNIRQDYKFNENGMLAQYIERFQKNPAKYKDDSDNEVYQEWYDALKNGTLLDSCLEWAPEVYVEDVVFNRSPNPEFLAYLGRQVSLHKHQAKFGERHTFLKTIRQYYPEFTAKLSVIPSQIDEMQEQVTSTKLREELVSEVMQKGVSRSFVDQILEDEDAGKIKTNIGIARVCSENDYCTEMFQYCVTHGFTPDDSDLSKTVNNILHVLQVEELATVLINETLEGDEVVDVIKGAMRYSDQKNRTLTAKCLLDSKLQKKALKGVAV
jgi:hypothetical protein